MRPTAQELLNDEWFASQGLVKNKPQEFKFKETAELEGFASSRNNLDKSDNGQRNLSQGRAIAEKISTAADRSRDKRIGGGVGNSSSGLLVSTSMGKFQPEVYHASQKSSSNLGSTMTGYKHSNTMQYIGSPSNDHKDSAHQPLQLRSLSKGRSAEEEKKLPKNHYFNYTLGSPTYANKFISNSEISPKTPQEYIATGDASAQKQFSKVATTPYSNLPPKQLYPLLQNSQQSPVYEDSPQQGHQQVPTPISLNSTLRSNLGQVSPTPAASSMGFTYQPKSQFVEQEPDIVIAGEDYAQISSPQIGKTSVSGHVIETQEKSMKINNQTSDLSQGHLTLISNLKTQLTEMESNNQSLEKKVQVLQQSTKELKKENTMLKNALETFRDKELDFEKLKKVMERNEKEMQERLLETKKWKEDYEILKNEILEIARFIRSNIKRDWVVITSYCSQVFKMSLYLPKRRKRQCFAF